MFGSSLDSSQLLQALYETLYMVTVSLVIGADWYTSWHLVGGN